jgi:hypothetical protein
LKGNSYGDFMLNPNLPAVAPVLSSGEWQKFERVGGWIALLGVFTSMFGLSWDIQWHADVGPDTFWTVPHLFVYAGAALTGFATLTVVLLASQVARKLERRDWIPVLGGMFHAPVGFVIAGFGAFGFLMFGFFDQWWHTIYGFDAILGSPPHVGLFISLIASMIGCILIYGTGRQPRPLELVVGMVVMLTFSVPVGFATLLELGWTIFALILPALLIVWGMMFAVSVSRNPWMASWVGLAFAVVRESWQVLFPIFTQAYADSLGLSLRDFNTGVQFTPTYMPMLAPLSGLLMTGLIWLGQSRAWTPLPVLLVAGTLAAVILYITYIITSTEVMLMAAPTGALAAWLGWQFGVIMRHINEPRAAQET